MAERIRRNVEQIQRENGKSNILLIGMPGAGKTTVGAALAVRLGKKFIDTDDIVSEKAEMALKDYVTLYGKKAFMELQETAICDRGLSDFVVATGGSVGTSSSLMGLLKKDGWAVYLHIDYSLVEQRLEPGRSLARDGGKTLKDLYDERTPLYEAFADVKIECTGKTVEAIVEEILRLCPNLQACTE